MVWRVTNFCKSGVVVEDADAVVCGYAEEPGQALRNITLNVREVSSEEKTYRFFMNTAPKTHPRIVDELEPRRILHPS